MAPILLIATLAMLWIAGAQAQLDRTLFELDKDATNNTTYTKAGVLNAAVATAADGAVTSIQICQADATFADGTIVLIDAERMSLAGGANVAGGGCPAGFTNKRSYNATRGLGDTVPGAHAKAEDVSKIDTGTISGADWDQIYAEVNANAATKCTDLGAVECAFTHDARAASIFTQSKDYDEISGTGEIWKWRDQSVPDADELDDGFAVKYIDGNGDQQLYFGADRFATNGTKDAGFWFFHNTVTALDPVGSADGLFDGLHTAPTPGTNGKFCVAADGGSVPGGQNSPVPACTYDNDDTGGDVLILTTFTGGGAVTTIRVFEWVGPAGSVAALLERGTAADCAQTPNTASLCATVNNTTVETAWAYSGKSEPANNEIPSGGLLEGGVNLSDLGLEGCFSSFMATTRSSASLTADPKDFILGSFEACATEVSTTPADGSGTALTDSDDPTNGLPDTTIGTGAAGVDVTDTASMTVNGLQTWSGTVAFHICGPIASGTCDTGGVSAGTKNVSNLATTATSDAVNLTEVGRYCWRGDFTPSTQSALDGLKAASDHSAGECFEVKPVQPTLATQAVDENGADLTAAVPFGDAVYDKASLSGTAYKPGTNGGTTPGQAGSQYPSINADMDTKAAGTITFTLVGPGDCTTVAAKLSGGIGTNPETGVAVTGDDDYYSSGFTPAAPGDYHWKASYTGDSPNTLGATHNDSCDDTNEDVTVQQLQPNMDTEQNFVPNDSATITVGTGGGDLAGSVVFKLYVDDTDCSGTAAYTSDPIDITTGTGSGTSRTVVSGNTTAYDADGTTFSWVVEYTSTNTAHLDVSSDCGNETSSITIDNGVTQPPAGP